MNHLHFMDEETESLQGGDLPKGLLNGRAKPATSFQAPGLLRVLMNPSCTLLKDSFDFLLLTSQVDPGRPPVPQSFGTRVFFFFSSILV